MAKWDFKIVGASFVKELVPVADDVQPRSQSFMQPSFHLEGGKIVIKESGQYVTAIYFPQIGEIDGVAPTDIEDALAKLLTLVENFNGGGGTPQNLAQTLAIDNKTNEIPILSNSEDGYAFILDDRTIVGNDFGGEKNIKFEEDTFTLNSTVRYLFNGKGIDIGTTSDGLGLPRLTTTQMNAIVAPTEGMIVYNTTESETYQYNGATWNALGGGVTQDLAMVLAIDNKTNDIPIVSNSEDGYLYVNDEQTILGNDFGGVKKITISEDTFALESTVRIDIEGKGVNMNTTTDGFLMPRVTTSQMNAINVLLLNEGLLVYNTTESKFYQYNGTDWVAFGSGGEESISTAKIINRCPDDAFRNAHGNVKVGDVQFYSTTTTPAKVLRFPNPDDLSEFTFEDFDSSFGWFLYMCYDEVNGKIYVPANLNRIIVFNDITDLSDYTVETITLTGGAEFSGSAPIETDGSYIYLGTAQTPLSRFIKIDLTDFSVTEIVDWVGAGSAPRGAIHSCAWNADKSKLYFANQATDYETGFAAEVNASDMTYTEFLQGTEGTTDDIAYIPYIVGGAISFSDFLVLPQEYRGPGTPGCYVVDLQTKVRYPLQTMPATGVYWYQDDLVYPAIELLYVCGKDGFVQVFTGENLLKSAMNLENPELMYDLYVEKNGNWINEIVRIGDKIFGTIWDNALTDEKGALVELELIKVNSGAISKLESVYSNLKPIKVKYQQSVTAVNYIDISGANGGSWNELYGDYVPKFTAFNAASAVALTGSWISDRSSLGFRLNFPSPVTADLDYRIVIEP